MTASAFERIPIGAPITEVETQVGTPYSTTSLQKGMQQYRYIERIETGPAIISQNTYILIVKEGRVIDKRRANESQTLNLQIR
jgi:hypothetical protein